MPCSGRSERKRARRWAAVLVGVTLLAGVARGAEETWVKAVTERWPTSIRSGAQFVMPTGG